MGRRVSTSSGEARLTPPALAVANSLLWPGEGLADICMWVDEYREVPGSDPRNCVNVPLPELRYDPRYYPPAEYIVSGILGFKNVLMGRHSARNRKRPAPKPLPYSIQDLRQALHVSDTGSRGGNMIWVRFLDVGSNLHEVWNARIAERHSPNEQAWLGNLMVLRSPGWSQTGMQ
jgi:hypothetical protein